VPGPKTGCGEPSLGAIVVNELGPLVMIGEVVDKSYPNLPPPHSDESRLSSCPVSSTTKPFRRLPFSSTTSTETWDPS